LGILGFPCGIQSDFVGMATLQIQWVVVMTSSLTACESWGQGIVGKMQTMPEHLKGWILGRVTSLVYFAVFILYMCSHELVPLSAES
jgi:hypothetical protein